MRIIRGYLQNYAWGIPGGLNPWLAEPRGDSPQAELWFGTHPNGPSPLARSTGALDDVVSPEDVPLLVKLLAAAVPLSIQIHPEADLARTIFQTQSPDRILLPDDRAKIEMLVALQEFSVFAGTRDEELAVKLLRSADPRLAPVADAVVEGGFAAGVRAAMALPSDDLPGLIDALVQTARQSLPESAADALAIAATAFPGDPGVVVAALLQQETLAPGSAVYMPAGGAHAYVRGFGLEVMTASDNVLRLGMTSKEIALDEGLAAVSDDAVPQFLPGPDGGLDSSSTIIDYRPAGAPFKATLVEAASTHSATGKYRLALCVSGSATVSVGEISADLAPGEAAVVLAAEPTLAMDSPGLGFVIDHRPENDAAIRPADAQPPGAMR